MKIAKLAIDGFRGINGDVIGKAAERLEDLRVGLAAAQPQAGGDVERQLVPPVGSLEYREYVKDIYESGKHLLALVDDLLDFSKIEARSHKLNEEQVNVFTGNHRVATNLWRGLLFKETRSATTR